MQSDVGKRFLRNVRRFGIDRRGQRKDVPVFLRDSGKEPIGIGKIGI